jgi:hypothetical protein
MCFYDVEPCEVWVPKDVKARKEHRCMECGRTILRGERYLYVTGIFDGGPFTHKECWRCQALRDRIVKTELASGCSRHDADPGCGRLLDAANEMDLFPRSNRSV